MIRKLIWSIVSSEIVGFSSDNTVPHAPGMNLRFMYCGIIFRQKVKCSRPDLDIFRILALSNYIVECVPQHSNLPKRSELLDVASLLPEQKY